MKETTNEEYETIIKELEFIKNERKKLEKLSLSHEYNAHIVLGNNFGELKINLLRDNQNINKEMKLLIKEYLYNNKDIDEEKINNIIDKLKRTTKEEQERIDEDIKDKNYNNLYQNIKLLVDRKTTNDKLISYINNLEEKEENLISRKRKYEKSIKRKTLFKQKKESNK